MDRFLGYWLQNEYELYFKKIEENKYHYMVYYNNETYKCGFIKDIQEFKSKLGMFVSKDFKRLYKLKCVLNKHKEKLLNGEKHKLVFKNYDFSYLDLGGMDFKQCEFINCNFKGTKKVFASFS